MIELKYPEDKYLAEYDVYIKPYLTVEEISVCIDAVTQCEDYLSKLAALDGCLLNFCVRDMELDGTQYNLMLASGFIDAVRNSVVNVQCVWDCITYEESMVQSVKAFVKELIKFINQLGEKLPDAETSKEMLNKLTENIDVLQKIK